MAQRSSEKAYFTFIKGLNTEASPFTFPENSSADEENFELLTNGARRRRLGIDYETGYSTASVTIDTSLQAITTHEWRDAGGIGDTNFAVVQHGRYLRFYTNDTVLSNGMHATVIDLSTYKVSTSTQAEQNISPVDCASGKGYLFVVGQHMEPIYLTYDAGGNTITASTFTCRMREFTRLDDNLEINTTPLTLSDEHRYNLLNQGWSDLSITKFFDYRNVYPSNSNVMALGWTVNVTTGLRLFVPGEITKYEVGSTPAPNGSLITNVFNTTTVYDSGNSLSNIALAYNETTTVTVTVDRSHGMITGDTVTLESTLFTYTDTTPDTGEGDWDGTYTITKTGATTFTITVVQPTNYASNYSIVDYGQTNINSTYNPVGVQQQYRFTAVSFYAGRVWFSGVSSDTINSRIFYSQVIQDINSVGRLHQEADPTSEEDPAVVDTDGGYLIIPEMGQVSKMVLFGSKLIILSTSGLYAVGGGAEDYFKATSFTVRKIIDLSMNSPLSAVNVDGAILTFTKQGIYQISEDPTSGLTIGKSISENTIQTLFSVIPDACLPYVSAIYDDTFKRVVWTYSIVAGTPKKHTKILVLDLRLQAWSVFTIPASGVFVSGGMAVRTTTTKDKKLKFFTIDNTNNIITWSDLTNTSWLDWYTFNSVGIDAPAYVLVGHELVGDVMRKKQVPYIFVYCKRSETQWLAEGGAGSAYLSPQSSCMVQARWDFADSTAGNKIGTAFQAYRHNRVQIAPDTLPATFDPGYSIVITKNKIRGVGKAIQLKFYTEAGKDCYIYGWATTLSGYTEV